MADAEQVLTFARSMQWNQLPDSVRHQARRCLLDTLGALLAGSVTPVARAVADFSASQLAGDEATILGRDRRLSAVGAALSNGFAANALDIDDGFRRIKGHPGATVLPPLWAAAERRGDVGGEDFLCALVVGYEVGIRAGLLRHARSRDYHSSGSWGAIAGCAAAGRVAGLSESALRHALGIAEYHAPIAPMMKCIDTPSMGKDSIGWGAMTAMSAVLLAERGFTGVRTLFDDAAGQEEESWVASLGSEYLIHGLYFKPFAACRWAQPAIAGALELVDRHRLVASDIAEIRIRTFEAATRLSMDHPTNTEEAQYNLSFPVAAAVVDGEVGPAQVLPPRLGDPTIAALAERVTAVVEPDYERAFPEHTYADVEIVTRDGARIRSARMKAIWDAPDSLPGDDELERKFRSLVDPLYGAGRSRDIAETVWNLPTAGVAALTRLCARAAI